MKPAYDAHFGSIGKPVDWRGMRKPVDDLDDDADRPTEKYVVDLLGFDPADTTDLQDDFNERDHPRDKAGKFTSGGGGSSSEGTAAAEISAGAIGDKEQIAKLKIMAKGAQGTSPERKAIREGIKNAQTKEEAYYGHEKVVASFLKQHDRLAGKGKDTGETAFKINNYCAKHGIANPLDPADALKGMSKSKADDIKAAVSSVSGSSGAESGKSGGASYSDVEVEAFNRLAGLIGKDAAKSNAAQAKAMMAQDKSVAKMSPAEASHIVAYSGSTYTSLNRQLREEKVEPKMWGHVNGLNAALEKLPVHEGEVYRKASLKSDVHEQYKVGIVVEERGFTSTSTNKDVWHGNVHFTIKSLTGRRIEKLSKHKSEKEVLFRSGTRFRVTRREEQTNALGKRTIIHMEEVSGR